MKVIDRLLFRIFFCLEVIFFCVMYVIGSQGMRVVWRQEVENNLFELSTKELEREVVCLKNDVQAWQKNPFYKEKIAREQLQMARGNDTIYYLATFSVNS